MNNRQVSEFKLHVDNANETIQASDVNKLGKAINQVEKNIVHLSDKEFVDKALFVLENNSNMNSMFLDEIKNAHKIFHAKSKNIKFDEDELCIRVLPTPGIGEVQSVLFRPKYPSKINKVMVMVDDYIPQGARIDYFVSTDGSSFYPIKPNTSKVTELQTSGEGLFLKARLTKNKYNETPKLFGWAILYKDPMLDKLYGLRNIDLSKGDPDVGLVGNTILVRSRELGDKLVGVIDESTNTELYYDAQGRLDKIIERIGDEVREEKLNYGMYLNSKNQYEEVLLGTSKQLITEPPKDGELPPNLDEIVDGFDKEGDN